MVPASDSLKCGLGLLCMAGIELMAGASKASAQDHDVVVTGVWAEPNPLACPSTVYANIMFMGLRDYELGSGNVVIRFSYQVGGAGAWTQFAELPVVRAESDDPFRQWAVWPGDFASHPNNGAEFEPQTSSDHRFRAEAVYVVDGPDGRPADNTRETGSVPVAGTCSPDPDIELGCLLGGRFGKESILCLDPAKVEAIAEIIRALECGRTGAPQPPWCNGGVVDLCKFGPVCPLRSGIDVEVLFDDRHNGLKLAVITRGAKRLADMQPLRTPVRIGGETYTQQLRFRASPGERYYLAFWPSEQTRRNVSVPFPVLVRQASR